MIPHASELTDACRAELAVPQEIASGPVMKHLVRAPSNCHIPIMPLENANDAMAATSMMAAEAAESSPVVRRQLDWWHSNGARIRGEFLRAGPQQIMTIARGSSDHAATYAKYLIEIGTGIPVSSYSPSLTSIYGVVPKGLERTLFLAISQSGRSSDLLMTAKAVKDECASLVAIVNDEQSPLASISSLLIPQLAGEEVSVAATKSFIATLSSILQLAGHCAGRSEFVEAAARLPELLDEAGKLDWGEAIAPLCQTSSMFVIGRGTTLGIAQEAALKLKEVCGIHAEAFSAAEVRHGPMQLVCKGFLVLVFVPEDAGSTGIKELVDDFVARQATVITVGESYGGSISLPVVKNAAASNAPICMMQSFYHLAATVSQFRGLDPDRPRYLRKVTSTL